MMLSFSISWNDSSNFQHWFEDPHGNSHNDRQGNLLEMDQSYYSCPCDRDICISLVNWRYYNYTSTILMRQAYEHHLLSCLNSISCAMPDYTVDLSFHIIITLWIEYTRTTQTSIGVGLLKQTKFVLLLDHQIMNFLICIFNFTWNTIINALKPMSTIKSSIQYLIIYYTTIHFNSRRWLTTSKSVWSSS